ncbi:MAG: hypothetical protein HXM48_00045 [Leptotrichia sp.]|nr:hypothetical protein [Leptotrichia sp.]
MPKKFTNVIDRGRVTANKYNLTNNGDGTAIITDIESNINVPGTPLNKELFNPMQEGLIFTVETVHAIENSTDVYELEIDGLQGTSNLNGMPLFKGLSFNIKISETNTTNVVKIKISGNKYDLAKESGDTVVNLTVGELKRNRYYKVIFDSVRFTIPVEIIEYNPMFGANFGGLLGTPGTKKVGVAYYDVANNQTVVPTVENSLTYFESSKFIPISDYQTAKKLENLSKIETKIIDKGIALLKSGNIVILTWDSNYYLQGSLPRGTVLATLPAGYRPILDISAPVTFWNSNNSGTIKIRSNGQITWESSINLQGTIYVNASFLIS